jgi:hypothetical protein
MTPMRRWLINLALLAVVAALAIAARLEHQQDLSALRLTALDASDIQTIELQRAGEPAIRLEREREHWRMQAPFRAPADDALVARLLPVTEAEVQRTLPADAVDLVELGLDPPPIRLRLDALELRFGATDPVAEQRYVQIGDLVHLIEDRHLPQLLAPAGDWVSHDLLPRGFSPGLADLDGSPLGAGAVAGLAEAEARRVEPMTGALAGKVLRLESADGGDGLRFLIDDAGTRWSRLDQRLTYVFDTPPLPGLGQPPGAETARTPHADRGAMTPRDPFARETDEALLQLRPAPEPVDLLPTPPEGSMPTQKLRP